MRLVISNSAGDKYNGPVQGIDYVSALAAECLNLKHGSFVLELDSDMRRGDIVQAGKTVGTFRITP